jgi:peroxiredoxin
MGHIRSIFEEFEKRGTRVAAVLAQNMDKVEEYAERKEFPYPLLVDEDRSVVKAYGVYVHVNFESYNISRPGDFILDKDGRIKYMYIGSSQFDFPDDDEVLKVLDGLKEEQGAPV